jgi:hypothetical protein
MLHTNVHVFALRCTYFRWHHVPIYDLEFLQVSVRTSRERLNRDCERIKRDAIVLRTLDTYA